MIVDRDLLQDIGFTRGTGWDHEVWVYDGMFWVHFGEYDRDRWLSRTTHVDGGIPRKQLFKLLIDAIRNEINESNVELTEDW